ncbi:MAG: NAD-dependent malic enzyme [Proteobacteria bacterium]|nr:NAD-dependent malic enzyme [Pseudomonadota bacterium]
MPSHLDDVVETDLTGLDLLARANLNKGTAFTEAERDRFRLHGLLPPHVGTLDEQVMRRLKALRACDSDLDRYAFMRDLQDVNETLYYALLVANAEELMPIVYTPTVGVGCQRFSEVWRRPRGLFLSYPNRHRIAEILAGDRTRPAGAGHDRLDPVRVIVVSDGERILGLGDQGAGGMGIPIGKLSLYTACAGIHPDRTLPIFLDLGTDNPERLADPLYIGYRSPRVRGADYDAFVDEFVTAVKQRWPDVLLQWEDFAGHNAGALLARYRDVLCTFNDDIQGTAAVAVGALLSAINVTNVPLVEQRICLFGFGAAGCGIAELMVGAMVADGLPEAEARRRFSAIDRDGLLVEGMAVHPSQSAFVQPRAAVAGWTAAVPGKLGLLDVVMNAAPTVLIGVSGATGAFSEPIVRALAARVARPVIFPLSNPTSRAEAAPADLVAWSDGRALIGTGSPFPAVIHDGRAVEIAQTNNSYIFPGVGLGVLAASARRVTEGMFMASARALATLSPASREPTAPLLPPVGELRTVAIVIARAVAKQAMREGVAEPIDDATLEAHIATQIWQPVYREYRLRR